MNFDDGKYIKLVKTCRNMEIKHVDEGDND